MAQGINPNEMKRKAIADEKAKTDLSRSNPTWLCCTKLFVSLIQQYNFNEEACT
jgi:hypothetical protein